MEDGNAVEGNELMLLFGVFLCDIGTYCVCLQKEKKEPTRQTWDFSFLSPILVLVPYRWTKLDIRIVRSDACDELMNDVC